MQALLPANVRLTEAMLTLAKSASVINLPGYGPKCESPTSVGGTEGP